MALDRSQAPLSAPVTSIDLVKAESFILTNGVPVHVVRVAHQPVVKIELILKACKWNEPQNGVSYFASKMLSEGTRKRTAAQIADYIDGLGAFLDVSSGIDQSSVSIYCLTKHFHSMVELLSELLYDSVFPQAELEIQKNIKSQSLKVDLEKNNVVASKIFREKLFGKNHPYGQTIAEKDIPAINTPLLQYYHQFNMLPEIELILSGDVPDDLKSLQKCFGTKSTTLPTPPIHIMPDPQKGQFVEERQEAVQSSLRLGCRMFTKRHPDYIPMMIVNEILGGYFGSRLMKNIREEKGFTYGISSSVVSLKHQGYWIIGTDVKKEYTQQTLDEIYKELHILCTVPVPADELETVRNYMAGSLLASINTPFALADKFKGVYFYGLNYKFYQDFLSTLYQITPEDIMRYSQKYFVRENLTEVIVGGMS